MEIPASALHSANILLVCAMGGEDEHKILCNSAIYAIY